MNIFYRITNAVIGTTFATILGFAAYKQAPEVWNQLDANVAAPLVIVTMVGILVLGFATLETRKY